MKLPDLEQIEIPEGCKEGKLDLMGKSLRVYTTKDGKSLINSDDLLAFFGFKTHEEMSKELKHLERVINEGKGF